MSGTFYRSIFLPSTGRVWPKEHSQSEYNSYSSGNIRALFFLFTVTVPAFITAVWKSNTWCHTDIRKRCVWKKWSFKHGLSQTTCWQQQANIFSCFIGHCQRAAGLQDRKRVELGRKYVLFGFSLPKTELWIHTLDHFGKTKDQIIPKTFFLGWLGSLWICSSSPGFLCLGKICKDKLAETWNMLISLCLTSSFVFFSHEEYWVVAFSPTASSTEQTSPASPHLYGEEHPVEPLFSELWRRGLHARFQPEPRLQVANGNEALQSAALLRSSPSPPSERPSFH